MKLNNQDKIFVANWKMNKSYTDALQFAYTYGQEMGALIKRQGHTIIICPTFLAIAQMHMALKPHGVAIGAQNCSRHEYGSYTGDVAAQSLAQAGCTYTLIGHAERRKLYGENDIDIEHKLKEALKAGITPIICVGEPAQDHLAGTAHAHIQKQLEPLFNHINNMQYPITRYMIAYEPVWAIGTGKTPAPEELTELMTWLASYCSSKSTVTCKLLYGGSVKPHNATSLLSIAHLDGLLIGGASLEFSSFTGIMQAT